MQGAGGDVNGVSKDGRSGSRISEKIIDAPPLGHRQKPRPFGEVHGVAKRKVAKSELADGNTRRD